MSNQLWEKFARMVLHANYEATLLAAAGHDGGSGHVFLTFIGGGVFRNDMAWIVDAISRAVWNVSKIGNVQLQVHVCHYREVRPSLLPPFPSNRLDTPLTIHTSGAFHSPALHISFFTQPSLVTSRCPGQYGSCQSNQLELAKATAGNATHSIGEKNLLHMLIVY
jgi:hypothetical protein